jgi:hypothetical protein
MRIHPASRHSKSPITGAQLNKRDRAVALSQPVAFSCQRDVLRSGNKRPRITLVTPPRLLPIVAINTNHHG